MSAQQNNIKIPVEVISQDPFKFLCTMIPEMARQEDKLTRLIIAKQLIDALSELEFKK